MMIMVVIKMQQLSWSSQMRYGKNHNDLKYDIKCIELNQNYYIICLIETMKEKK